MSKIESDIRQQIISRIDAGEKAVDIANALGIDEYTVRLVKAHMTRAANRLKTVDNVKKSKPLHPDIGEYKTSNKTEPCPAEYIASATTSVDSPIEASTIDNVIEGDKQRSELKMTKDKISACIAPKTKTNTPIKYLLEQCFSAFLSIGAEVHEISACDDSCEMTGTLSGNYVSLWIERK